MSGKAECYKLVCENIRETDKISFQLLRLIPLSTTFGAGLLTFIQTLDVDGIAVRTIVSASILILSLAGAALVFGFYKWEMRNIKKCESLIKSAVKMEDENTGKQYTDWDLAKNGWGKTESEKLIYGVAIGAWAAPALFAAAQLWCPLMKVILPDAV